MRGIFFFKQKNRKPHKTYELRERQRANSFFEFSVPDDVQRVQRLWTPDPYVRLCLTRSAGFLGGGYHFFGRMYVHTK